jgi:alpha-L-fucosidase
MASATKTTRVQPIEEMRGDASWFVKDRFGLFIHWGLYAMGARGEWLKLNHKDYEERYFHRFDPDLYNPDVWADAAAYAGMKYFVVTTKHHDGFCMWDSSLTDYKAPNTPAGRDLIKPMVAAFRQRGFKTGFYHSIIDWHHPHYAIDPHLHPLRESPDRDLLNQKRNHTLYIKYLHNSVREILTKYGKIDVLWLDFSYPKPDGSGKGHKAWDSAGLYNLVRKLQPDVLLHDRLDLSYTADILTPEQNTPREGLMREGRPAIWEACHTLSGGSWTYDREGFNLRSAGQLIAMLIDCVSKNGNMLLNVGPNARGEMDPRTLERLREIGDWMRVNERSIHNCGAAPKDFPVPPNCALTYNAERRRLYLHIFSWPAMPMYIDFGDQVKYAQLLHDGSEVLMAPAMNIEGGITTYVGCSLQLPMHKPDVAVPVIEFFLD